MRKIIVFFLLQINLLLADEIKENCPPILQEILALPEEEQYERCYTKETITWRDFTFTYCYPNPTINTLLAEWTNNKCFLLPPNPLCKVGTTNYSSHPDDVQALWNECEQRGLLREFFFFMIEHPQKFCSKEGFAISFTPLKVSECGCINTGAYNRLIRNRRENFENNILLDLKTRFPNKNNPLRFMSLGYGDLLQETILLGKLIREGYSYIEITLVDFYENKEGLEAIQHFFAEYFPEIHISWTVAETLSGINPQEQFDFIYAIDFDDLFDAYEIKDCFQSYRASDGTIFKEKIANPPHTYPYLNLIQSYNQAENEQRIERIDTFQTGLGDIIKAKQLLTPTGSFFLGFSDYDMKLNRQNSLTLFSKNNVWENEPVFQTAPQVNTIHILSNIYQPGTLFSLLLTFLDRGCQSIHLTLEERDYVSMMPYPTFDGTKQMEEREFIYKTTSHQFMKRLFPAFSERISVELVDDIRPHIEGAHATFLDTEYLRGDLAEYDGATYTTPLNE